MKAFLLAAGHGTRLRPLTDTIPKCLVPIQGTPLLDIWLDLCATHGIEEVLLNVHAKAEVVRAHVASRSCPPIIHIFEEETLLGSAGTIRANRQWVEAEPFFWIFYADVLTNANLTAMRNVHLSAGLVATLGLYEVCNPQECGIAVTDEAGVIRHFVEKPHAPVGNLAFSGLAVGARELLNAIPAKTPCDLSFDVLPFLMGRMVGYRIAEYLADVGSWEKYARCQENWPGLTRRIRDE